MAPWELKTMLIQNFGVTKKEYLMVCNGILYVVVIDQQVLVLFTFLHSLYVSLVCQETTGMRVAWNK